MKNVQRLAIPSILPLADSKASLKPSAAFDSSTLTDIKMDEVKQRYHSLLDDINDMRFKPRLAEDKRVPVFFHSLVRNFDSILTGPLLIKVMNDGLVIDRYQCLVEVCKSFFHLTDCITGKLKYNAIVFVIHAIERLKRDNCELLSTVVFMHASWLELFLQNNESLSRFVADFKSVPVPIDIEQVYLPALVSDGHIAQSLKELAVKTVKQVCFNNLVQPIGDYSQMSYITEHFGLKYIGIITYFTKFSICNLINSVSAYRNDSMLAYFYKYVNGSDIFLNEDKQNMLRFIGMFDTFYQQVETYPSALFHTDLSEQPPTSDQTESEMELIDDFSQSTNNLRYNQQRLRVENDRDFEEEMPRKTLNRPQNNTKTQNLKVNMKAFYNHNSNSNEYFND